MFLPPPKIRILDLLVTGQKKKQGKIAKREYHNINDRAATREGPRLARRNREKRTGKDHHERPGRNHKERPGRDHHERPRRNHEERPGRDHHERPGRNHEEKPGRVHKETADAELERWW
ncbi:hypothetical protein EDB19DRAFT_1835323 [Suillus lakei]|nr:hypothetical protein EDB19DRAFT_1835323 [Suillus lakei]